MTLAFSKVQIQRPAGTNRDSLSIDALDARSREIAKQTFIGPAGVTISVRRYEKLENGDLLLVIPENDWEYITGPPLSDAVL